MASYTASVDDLLILFQFIAEPIGNGVFLDDVSIVDDAFTLGYGHVFTEGVGFHEPFLAYDYAAGAIVDELIKIHGTTQLQFIYSQAVLERLKWLDTVLKGQAVGLTDHLNLHLAQVFAQAVLVTQKLGLHDVQVVNSFSQLSLLDRLLFDPVILDFFGLGGIDGIGIADVFSAQFMFNKTLTQDLGFQPTLSETALFLRVVDDDITIEDAQVLTGIYQGTLDDNISISIGMFDPGGGFTTWAVNTRTNALTEYSNFQFNSFAKIGNEYYGANDDGLWLLNSETDAGANIVSDVKGGLLAFGDSKYTQFDGIYLGLRTSDNARDWLLKIHTPGTQSLPEGATYVYQFVANEYRTTRINTGKGIRTRFFSWELITPGPDFSLDSVEFVPLISKRRV
jgi:hypothetical protein